MSRFYRVTPKIASEGYCCIWGYLKLCRARGETKKSMSEWSGMNFWTIKDHYRRLVKGQHQCMNYSDCLRSVIEDVQPGPGDLRDNPNRPD